MRPLAAAHLTYDPAWHLFEPDIMQPSQLQRTPERPCEPERKLMAAVLREALADLRRGRVHWNGCRRGYAWGRTGRRKGQLVKLIPSRAFILSHDRDWAYSFENICDHLGLDPAVVRDSLRKEGLL
jgi:hypothetical protein